MDVVLGTVFITMLLGAPQGIILSAALAAVAAAVRSRGTPGERVREMLRTPFLWAGLGFSLTALILEDWQMVALVWLVAAFIINAWRTHGTATDRDRSGLIGRFSAALAGIAMAWLLVNWVTTPPAAWLAAVTLLAAGMFGVVLRWPELPWFAGPRSRTREIGAVANLACSALIIGVPFLQGG